MQAIDSKERPDQKAKKPLSDLKRDDVSLYELNNNQWRVIVTDDNVTPRELHLHPTFFNMLAEEVREGDEIAAMWNNGKFIAKFVVVNVANGAVAAGLAYEVPGAPLMSVIGPKVFPAGYHIEKARLDEGRGFVVVRETDGMRIPASTGLPWKSHQAAWEEFPKSNMFQSAQATRYTL